MDRIKISNKMQLDNGDVYFIIEKIFDCDTISKNNNKVNYNFKPLIEIRAVRKPISLSIIFLTRNEEYVGHISANLYDNGVASMVMSGIHNIYLPYELEQFREIIEKHDTALLVNEKYRRQGKAGELMKLMFQYLDKKGITDLEVNSISDDIAMYTYLRTGAEMIDSKNVVYKDIKRFLSNEITKDNTNEMKR